MKPGPTWSLPAFVAALGCAAATSAGGFAGGGAVPDPAVHLRERVVHYEVEGATVQDVSRSLDRERPPSLEGRFRGYTQWNLSWSYRFAPRSGGCGITDADVRLVVTTTLPRWRRDPEAEEELERQWSRYIAALEAHEAGHRDYAVRAANDVLEILRELRTSSCAHMRDEANARGRWALEHYRALNRTYDDQTGHGRTQGATWPPAGRAGGSS